MPSPTTTFLAGVAVALTGNMATNAIDPPDSWTWWPWAVWTAVALLVGGSLWIEVARRRATVATKPDDVVTDLLAPIERVWAREAVRREVTRPAPVLVHWSSTGRLAAGRPAVLGDPSAGGWQDFPLSGATDTLNTEIVAAFRGLPRRQLVVLGEPGAGKSVFALLLTLGLIRTRADGEPLPVLISVNGWHPADPIEDFLARRLAEDQRAALARHGDPLAVARRLVEQNRVLPLLDGLDELPTPAIGSALRALDEYASAGRPLVVTCRVREYEKAGHILTTAAVVELAPVTADAAVAYLSYPESARDRWEPVFARLRRADRADPLVRTLSTPLMVSLARTAYQSPGTSPAELLTLQSRPVIAGRLMDAFLTAAYPGAKQRRWLSCLAYHLYTAGTRDLRWWQFDPGMLTARPDRARRSVVIVAALIAALLAGTLAAVAGLVVHWAAVTAALIVAVAASGRLRRLWPADHPPTEFSPVGDGHPHPFRTGFLSGVLTGFITTRWTAALIGGLICGALLAAWFAWRKDTVHPRPIAHTIVSGAVFAAVATAVGSPPALVGGTAAALYGSTAALCGGGWSRVRYRLTHVRLAVRGRLPWRLTSFLADAHRRGVLRRPGAVYQFRHVLLQDRLAGSVRRDDLEIRAGAGNIPAVRTLAEDLVERGETALAVEVLARAGRADVRSADRLAGLLVELGRLDQLRDRADRGDVSASRALADRLVARGDLGELRERAAAGDPAAHARVLALMAEHGDADGLLAAVADGDPSAALHLADLHVAAGRRDDAIALLEGMDGDWAVGRRLADLRREAGDIDGAVAILRGLAHGGDGLASAQLADLYVRQDRISELWTAATTGDPYAGDRLSRHLFERKNLDGLRTLAAKGVASASARRADLLVLAGDVTELMPLAIAGDGAAARGAARVLADRGETGTAIALLHALTDVRDSGVALLLAELLARQGEIDEAIAILRPRAEDGDEKAAEVLAELQRTDQE
ncbi:NACHT domain-containing protein [Actinoplanes sp. NEAU-A12]|uniref:NACHT domain-containing protein n=1 Tax=Actinoplanes sandaracinus TaxID=3045177 RepID=A0ABT6WY73_9ACTN|nr:NACHT domain-containing protein [Actinoplanes sandaracinus]MDI6104684.1 NACHT domain-containing protein [Actinoplanes sandaracinus]